MAKSKGLGDTVEKVTKATGIKEVVKAVFKDCGCNERKEWLNRKYPYYNKNKNCMTEEQYKDFSDFKKRNPKVLEENDQNLIHSMYNSIFAVNTKPCSDCSSAQWKGFILRLENVYNNYKK